MTLLADYRSARHDETVARLRRALALRALVATGSSQREVATALGISQPAVSQQLAAHRDLIETDPATVVEAAAPILVRIAEGFGFSRLAVFGSVARHTAGAHSDLDLLVEAPPGTTIAELERLRAIFEKVVGRHVDLVTYGGLDARRNGDVLREAVEL